MANATLRILVVDDSKDDAILVQRVIRQCKILNPVSFFENGSACIDHIKTISPGASDEEVSPALIFLDLIMARTSGLDVLTFLKHHPYSRNCITVMLSGLKDIQAIHQGYQLGAKTFLLKPITQEDILHLINSLPDRIMIEESENGYLLHWHKQGKAAAQTASKSPEWRESSGLTNRVN